MAWHVVQLEFFHLLALENSNPQDLVAWHGRSLGRITRGQPLAAPGRRSESVSQRKLRRARVTGESAPVLHHRQRFNHPEIAIGITASRLVVMHGV